MPIYEYICTQCEEVTELLRPSKLRDKPISCPKCEGRAKRSLSAHNVISASGDRTVQAAPESLRATPVKPRSLNFAFSVGDGGTVSNCYAEDAEAGVSVPKGARAKISNCEFRDVDTAIRLEPS